MLRNDGNEQAAGVVGSATTWMLAVAGWSLTDVQQIVNIGAGIAAMIVSLVTLWFMLRKRRGK